MQSLSKYTYLLPVVLIFCLMTCITLLGWQVASDNVSKQKQEKFDIDAKEVETKILNRLEVYTNALYSFSGLFDSSDDVARDEFQIFFRTLNLPTRYPGISAISFIQYLRKDEKDAFIRYVKTDTSFSPEGFPAFTVKPEGDREEYFVGNYIEPVANGIANTATFGLDFGTIPARGNAIREARDTGMFTVTEPIELLGSQANQKGFIVYAPLYMNGLPHESLAEKRENFFGALNAVYNAELFFNGIFGESEKELNDIQFAVYYESDLDEKNVIYRNSTTENNNPSFQKQTKIKIANHSWTIEYKSSPAFGLSGAEEALPKLIGVAGLITGLLICIVVLILSASRFKAETIAQGMTKTLKASQQELRDYIDNMATFTAKLDKNGMFILANRSVMRATKLSEKDLVKTNFIEGSWFNYDSKVLETVKAKFARALRGEIINFDQTLQQPGAKPVTINLSFVPVFDSEKNVQYIIAEGRDITPLKEAEENLKKQSAELVETNKTMVNRELKMIDLKKENEELKRKINS